MLAMWEDTHIVMNQSVIEKSDIVSALTKAILAICIHVHRRVQCIVWKEFVIKSVVVAVHRDADRDGM